MIWGYPYSRKPPYLKMCLSENEVYPNFDGKKDDRPWDWGSLPYFRTNPNVRIGCVMPSGDENAKQHTRSHQPAVHKWGCTGNVLRSCTVGKGWILSSVTNYAWMHVCMYVCMYVGLYVCVCMCVYIYIIYNLLYIYMKELLWYVFFQTSFCNGIVDASSEFEPQAIWSNVLFVADLKMLSTSGHRHGSPTRST